MNKIIQIAACGHENTSSTQSNVTLFALTDDGRLFSLSNNTPEWRMVPLPDLSVEADSQAPFERGRFAMVQLNEGTTSVTIHDTEEEAYADIIETVMNDLHWIGLDPEDINDQVVLNAIDLAVKHKIASKEIYTEYIEYRLEGIEAGFWMEVTENVFQEKGSGDDGTDIPSDPGR